MVQAEITNTAFPWQQIYDEFPIDTSEPFPHPWKYKQHGRRLPGRKLATNPEFQIRLLQLLPGTYHHPVVCNFVPTTLRLEYKKEDLESKPQYFALSYAAQDTTVFQPIKINNKLFGVPENVFLALKRVRVEKVPTLLWIGGICINRSSPEEKRWHAFYLKEIIENALMVYAWLGEERATGGFEELMEGIGVPLANDPAAPEESS